jgi:hypothetical protein
MKKFVQAQGSTISASPLWPLVSLVLDRFCGAPLWVDSMTSMRSDWYKIRAENEMSC